jgi:hypothetical protein
MRWLTNKHGKDLHGEVEPIQAANYERRPSLDEYADEHVYIVEVVRLSIDAKLGDGDVRKRAFRHACALQVPT